MKPRLIIWILGISIALIVSFLAGRALERIKSGYFYEVRNTEIVDSSFGPITLKYVTESIGIPILDPGTTVLTINDEVGKNPIVIYKAKRIFQESTPFARNVAAEENEIRWEDGLNRYRLRIERLPKERLSKPEAEPLDPANPRKASGR